MSTESLELAGNIGEQLAFGQTIEITDEAILHSSEASEGARVTLLECDDPVDIELFIDKDWKSRLLPVNVYPLDGHDKPVAAEIPQDTELTNTFLRALTSAILVARARNTTALDTM